MANDLKELRDLFAHDESEWSPIRAEGSTDMQYAAGDPWEPQDRARRLKANRPCLTADELSQYVNQVVNEVRSNKRAVKFTPIGNGATDQSAQFYADKMREIEYRSRAQIAYTTAFENCVQRSFGFVRVNARHPYPSAVNQELWIDPVPNPNLVTPDSQFLLSDLSDMQHCWVREAWSLEEFNAKWKKNRIAKFTSDILSSAAGWLKGDKANKVFVGEFWQIKTKKRPLLICQVPGQPDPVGIFEDDFDAATGAVVLKTESRTDQTVIQQLTNGLEILEETEWPGKYIPIIGCLGKVLYVEADGDMKRQILSMIRLARNMQMMLAYIVSAKAETIGSLTKFPYFAYEGQLSQKSLNDIAASIHENVAVVQVKATVEGLPPGSGPLGFPQRNPWTLDLSSLEMAQESTRRSIQAAMGQTPLPTAAQRRNEKSGVALKHIEELGQRGSYHFTDHYLDMIQHTGIVVEDLIDKFHDTPQDTGIRKDDDTAETIRINDPRNPKSVSTKGDHLVTVSTGPSFDSERDAANEFAGDLLESPILQMLGPAAPKIIAKAIKLKNLGPIGDQMCEIIAPEPAKDGQPTTEQLQQQIEQSQGQMQQMGQQLQEAQQIIQSERVKQDTEIRKAEIGMNEAIEVQKLRNAGAIDVAMVNLEGKGVLDAHKALVEAQALGAEHAHALHTDASQQALEHAHELHVAQLQHDQAIEQSQVGHEQGLEAGDVAHQQALEAQAAAPQPEAGA